MYYIGLLLTTYTASGINDDWGLAWVTFGDHSGIFVPCHQTTWKSISHKRGKPSVSPVERESN